MPELQKARWDLLLLVSLLLLIVAYPMLDHGDASTIILGGLTFVPVVLGTLKLAHIKNWVWPLVLLMSVSGVCAVASTILGNRVLAGVKWGILSAFFALIVGGLFDYVRKAQPITNAHLLTAASIYLLLGMQWFALYSAIDVFRPGAFLHTSSIAAQRETELLYFSLVTLSTIGYGDIVPLHREVRMLAALEGITGVLYIAITVAVLVSAYKPRGNSS